MDAAQAARTARYERWDRKAPTEDRVNFKHRLRPAYYAWLQIEAQRRGGTMADVLDEALRCYAHLHKIDEPPPR